MEFIIQKENIGSPRVFHSTKRLLNVIMKAGATEAEITEDLSKLHVVWPEGLVTYGIAKNGRIDPQLAWDIE